MSSSKIVALFASLTHNYFMLAEERKFYTQETLLGEGHSTNSGPLCGPRNWHSWFCFPPRWRSQVLVSQPSLSPGNRIHLIFLRSHHSTQVCQFIVSTLPSSLLVVAPGSIQGTMWRQTLIWASCILSMSIFFTPSSVNINGLFLPPGSEPLYIP